MKRLLFQSVIRSIIVILIIPSSQQPTGTGSSPSFKSSTFYLSIWITFLSFFLFLLLLFFSFFLLFSTTRFSPFASLFSLRAASISIRSSVIFTVLFIFVCLLFGIFTSVFRFSFLNCLSFLCALLIKSVLLLQLLSSQHTFSTDLSRLCLGLRERSFSFFERDSSFSFSFFLSCLLVDSSSTRAFDLSSSFPFFACLLSSSDLLLSFFFSDSLPVLFAFSTTIFSSLSRLSLFLSLLDDLFLSLLGDLFFSTFFLLSDFFLSAFFLLSLRFFSAFFRLSDLCFFLLLLLERRDLSFTLRFSCSLDLLRRCALFGLLFLFLSLFLSRDLERDFEGDGEPESELDSEDDDEELEREGDFDLFLRFEDFSGFFSASFT